MDKKIKDLGYEYDGLLKGYKRGEQNKGTKSKYWPAIKARGGRWKTGGQVMKKGGRVKVKEVMPAWMKGMSDKEIREILGAPTYDKDGVLRHSQKRKKLKVKNAKDGGQVVKKAGGGKMSHVGLYPAEEARSGTMSEKKRAKNMAYGGKVKKYSKGGRVNTSRENRLEELGRVDAEKAHTSKGKRNLRSEKKRIVKELTGNNFVASHYDS
tara:strand:- start:42 stop:671 length:630 start_codon:yes stop_codon:yes gene_type:complete